MSGQVLAGLLVGSAACDQLRRIDLDVHEAVGLVECREARMDERGDVEDGRMQDGECEVVAAVEG
jgi:hypothetical protein